jgi:hypothetical protein
MMVALRANDVCNALLCTHKRAAYDVRLRRMMYAAAHKGQTSHHVRRTHHVAAGDTSCLRSKYIIMNTQHMKLML